MILTAFYDMLFGPISFDFVTWLVRAMLERDRRGAAGLHVVVVPNEGGLGGFSRRWGQHDEAAARWRLWHIVVASCPLAPATVTVAPTRAYADGVARIAELAWWPEGKAHFMSPLVDHARGGGIVPQLQPTAAARRYVAEWFNPAKAITLTTRSQSTDPDRNTNHDAWMKFGTWLIKCGYDVIHVKDAHVALGDGHGYAELDVDLRLALYEAAAMNFCGNNGPQELLKFSTAPYMIFGLALTPGWRDHFKRYFHMEVGAQLPWATARQRLVYRADTFDVLREEFEAIGRPK